MRPFTSHLPNQYHPTTFASGSSITHSRSQRYSNTAIFASKKSNAARDEPKPKRYGGSKQYDAKRTSRNTPYKHNTKSSTNTKPTTTKAAPPKKQKKIPKYIDYKEELEALAFLAIMDDNESSSSSPDEDGNNDISYLAKRAQRIFDEMYEKWVTGGDDCEDLEPTTEIYNLLIDVYSHDDDTGTNDKGVEIAAGILEKMEDSALGEGDVELPSPDISTYLSGSLSQFQIFVFQYYCLCVCCTIWNP